MKKIAPFLLAGAMLAMSFAACSNTVADVSTTSGGEVKVTESKVTSVETTVSTSAGEATAGATDEALTVTYTDPAGYTKTMDGGDVVTYTLDGAEMGKILYVPKPVQEDAIVEFQSMLDADAEQLKAYAEQFAANLDTDFTATKTTVGNYDALLIEGTIDDTATENPGAEAMVLVIPVGDRLITISGIADAATAAQVKADAKSFAESLKESGTAASSGVSTASSGTESSSMTDEAAATSEVSSTAA